MSLTLYEIDNALYSLIDEETGEVADYEAFEKLSMARDKKIENTALMIKNLEAEAEAIKKEKLSLEARQKTALNQANRLRQNLQMALDGEKFKTAKVSLFFKRSHRVEITDLSKIPDEYLKFVAPTPKKDDIREAINNGVVIDGAELIEDYNLQIR